ncbi:cysteine hydrolase family protein [Klebsiella pneumoniae]|uniref:cysteine hydrolase family protein n=1 Tax=Klebsiella pneumoniae TaxID=573 RepID=UPI003DA5F2BB
MLFPNFSLGEEYEHAPPATNRQISPYLPSGRFRTGLPVEGLAIERGDLFYACPRASVFYGTALDADLRTRGVSTLVMAGISTTGVVLSSVAWASDADYDGHCCKVSDEAAFCLIQRPYISKTLLTRRISPRGSP